MDGEKQKKERKLNHGADKKIPGRKKSIDEDQPRK